MFNFRNENSFVYRLGLRTLQLITAFLLLLSLALNNRLENTSDLLRNISIALQLFILGALGIKAFANENKIVAYINFAIIFIVLILIVYLSF